MTKGIHRKVAGLMEIKKVNTILGCIDRCQVPILRKMLERNVQNFQGDIVNSKDTYLLVGKLYLEILWSTPSLLFLVWFVDRWNIPRVGQHWWKFIQKAFHEKCFKKKLVDIIPEIRKLENWWVEQNGEPYQMDKGVVLSLSYSWWQN